MEDFFSGSDDDNNGVESNKIIANALNQFRWDLGRVNIIVAGKTGVGKSTLINAIFKQNLAETDIGRPVTQEICEYTKEGFPISIIDTKGLVLKDYENILSDLKKYISKRQNSEDAHEQIHVAWVCIAEGSARIEYPEKELVEMLSQFMPVIIVITKLTFDQGFQDVIRKIFPKVKAVIRVQSISFPIDDGYVIKPKNLEELAKLTNQYLPESMENAFVYAQKVSIELKETKSKLIILLAKKDAAISKKEIELIEVGIRMIASILCFFGLDLDEDFVIRISIIIFGDKKSKMKKFVNKVLRIVPGVKTELTPDEKENIMQTIGDQFIELLKEAYKNKENGEKPSENEVKYLLIDLCTKRFE